MPQSLTGDPSKKARLSNPEEAYSDRFQIGVKAAMRG
jgi:hypothetical protein